MKRYVDALKGQSEPPWVIDKLLLAKCGSLVSAHPHSMKSLSWLYACMEAPVTGQVFGHFAAPNIKKTLFIETEDPDWMVESRIRGFAEGLGLKNENDIPGFYYICPGPFNLVSIEGELDKLFASFKPDFAVLSTLQNLLAGRAMSRSEDMQPVHAVILSLTRKYCPIVLITHSPWDKEIKRAVGSVTQTADYAVTSHYTKNGNVVSVKLDSKMRGEESFKLRLETEDKEVRRIVYQGDVAVYGEGREKVLREIGIDPTASPKVIAARAGVGERYAREIINDLAAEHVGTEFPSTLAAEQVEQVPKSIVCH